MVLYTVHNTAILFVKQIKAGGNPGYLTTSYPTTLSLESRTMLIRLTDMETYEPGMKKLAKAYRSLVQSSCDHQMKNCLMAVGCTEEKARLSLCEMVRCDQIPCHMAFAGLSPVPPNPRAVIVRLERLDEDIETAGIFPDDFDDRWTFHGRFFLDGTPAPKVKE